MNTRPAHAASVRSIPALKHAIAAALCAASSAVAQVPGDECTNALPASTGFNGPVNTATMTPSANPPESGTCTFLNWTSSTKDVWWVYQVPAVGKVSIEMCSSNYDTSVVVYSGTCGSLTRIACDDDSCNPTGPTYQSKVVDLPVQAGTIYIRVGGWNLSTGQASFELRFTRLGAAVVWGGGLGSAPADLGLAERVAAGGGFGIMKASTGAVRCWGNNTFGQCNVPADIGTVSAVAAGASHSVAVTATGAVRCWGDNSIGACNVPADLGTVTAIGAGSFHTLAVTTGGSVRCWGSNLQGQSTPPTGLGTVLEVDGGEYHSVARNSSGVVRCWGENYNGQSTVPAGLPTAVAVVAGGNHTVALLATFGTGGVVRCWGLNSFGQCNVPAGIGGVAEIAAGNYHTVALETSGRVRCWGQNEFGQCDIPPGLGRAYMIAANSNSTIAIDGRDCDGDGAIDHYAVASRDCNGNGRHDCWDADEGVPVEDCNSNGIGDACEKQVDISLARSAFTIGFGSPATLPIVAAVPAVSNVSIRLQARGDFSSVLEYLRMRIGDLVDMQVLGGTGDCAVPYSEQFVTLSPDQFNRGIGPDGTWRASFVASSAVDANLCPTGTRLDMYVDYVGATSADCDANAELDSCQIAAGTVPDTNSNGVIDTCESPIGSCPGDLDLDGSVAGADLGILLGAWGPTTPETARADLNADGTVNGADLGALLGAWGPCTD
jgi:alpha-tubulin suppressor-like RCC1 family protein